jgi:hypothetical protein
VEDVVRERDGRRNRYQVVPERPLRPLGDADRGRDLAQADPRIIGHAGEDVGVLCQKVPATGGYLGNADARF